MLKSQQNRLKKKKSVNAKRDAGNVDPNCTLVWPPYLRD